MKILLFTHKIDIDGMGSAVLSKLAFESVSIEFCDTFETDEKILNKITDKSIYNFDQVFITDICPSEKILTMLSIDKNIKNKIKIFDHHISVLENLTNKYDIAQIEIENKNGKCSGTSLFYEYLIKNNLIVKSSIIDEFVELTRQYDTWEWKTKYNNSKANDLNIIFSILGLEQYIETFYNKLRNNFELFDELDIKTINDFKAEQTRICEEYIKNMHIETINGFVAGVIDEMQDKFKNDTAEILKSNNRFAIDFVTMAITNRNTLSFRSIKSEIDVSKIAESFGGKGHKGASSCELTNQIKNIFNIKK